MSEIQELVESWSAYDVDKRHELVDGLTTGMQDVAEPVPGLVMEDLFVEGMVARTGNIPEGTFFVSHCHLQEQVQVVSKGAVWVFDAETGTAKEYHAPIVFKGNRMAKRVVYALEDTVWTTVLATDAKTHAEVLDTCTQPTKRAALDRLQE